MFIGMYVQDMYTCLIAHWILVWLYWVSLQPDYNQTSIVSYSPLSLFLLKYLPGIYTRTRTWLVLLVMFHFCGGEHSLLYCRYL